jgi:hypothetical protein
MTPELRFVPMFKLRVEILLPIFKVDDDEFIVSANKGPRIFVLELMPPIEMDPPFKLSPMDMLDVLETPLIVSAFSIPTFAVPNV